MNMFRALTLLSVASLFPREVALRFPPAHFGGGGNAYDISAEHRVAGIQAQKRLVLVYFLNVNGSWYRVEIIPQNRKLTRRFSLPETCPTFHMYKCDAARCLFPSFTRT